MHSNTSQHERLSPWERLQAFVDPDWSVVESAPLDKVHKELNEAGIDPQPLIASIGKKVREVESLGVESGDSLHPGFSVETVLELLDSVGSACHSVAASAARKTLSLWRNHRDSLVQCLDGLLGKPLDAAAKSGIVEYASRQQNTAEIRAYRAFRETVTARDGIEWLKHPTGKLYEIVASPKRRIYAARVDPQGKSFTAAWLQLGPDDHVLLIHHRLQGQDRLRAASHELNHVMNELSAKDSREESTMDAKRATKESAGYVSFVEAQLGVDTLYKQLVARWVAEHPLLTNGDGVFIDAGTSCLEVWKAIADKIADDRFSNLTVYTDSLMVLNEWLNRFTQPQFQGTSVELVGELFDAPHQAFYGEAARRKLMAGHFRPSLMLIGTSGIEFDESGEILFGYHAGETERKLKELLLECPARRRTILATPQKIGFAGGRVFNVLSFKQLDARAPIDLVTVAPEPNTEEEERFIRAWEIFNGKKIQDVIKKKALRFHWTILDRDSQEVPKVIDPSDVGAKRGKITPK